jgi:hypothetical protein
MDVCGRVWSDESVAGVAAYLCNPYSSDLTLRQFRSYKARLDRYYIQSVHPVQLLLFRFPSSLLFSSGISARSEDSPQPMSDVVCQSKIAGSLFWRERDKATKRRGLASRGYEL